MDDICPSVELLRAILRFSLRATASSTVADFDNAAFRTAESPFDARDPTVRKFLEQILFSKRFITTYYFAIAGIVGIFTVVHWTRKTKRWLRRRRQTATESGSKDRQDMLHEDVGNESLSTSSTLRGIDSPSGKALSSSSVLSEYSDENTPLVVGNQIEGSFRRPSLVHRLQWHVKAFLMYQPAPIPAITSSTNHLPTNGTSLLILLFLGLNIFYLFYHVPLSEPMLIVIADRAGLCFAVNLPVLYCLAAKTNQPTKFLTGWSYEGLNILHRRLGEWMIFLATLHGAGMIGVWYILLRPVGLTLFGFLTRPVILLGVFTYMAYLSIYSSSIGKVRQLYYEAFLALHIFWQVAALAFLYFHYETTKPYVLAALAMWALDRLVTRMLVSATRATARLRIAPDGETVLLSCSIPIYHPTSAVQSFGSIKISHGWIAGQHVFITIPALSLMHGLQTHPFTIASPAPPVQDPAFQPGDQWTLELIIRSKDGFSKDLLAFARDHDEVQVILDGPYGNSEAIDALRHADRRCLIAGGSGIAVTYPLAWALLVKDEARAVVRPKSWPHFSPAFKKNNNSTTIRDGGEETFSRRRSSSPASFPSSFPTTSSSSEGFCHLWIRTHRAHDSWLTAFPRSTSMRCSSSSSQESPNIQYSSRRSITLPLPLHNSSTINPASIGLDSAEGQEEDGVDAVVQCESLLMGPSLPLTRESTTGSGRPDIAFELREWVLSRCDGSSSSGNNRSSGVASSGVGTLLRDSTGTGTDTWRNQRITVVISGPDSLVREARNAAARLVREGWQVEVEVEKFGW